MAKEARAWRWVPLWVSKSVVVLELLGQVRVLEAKNALLERERGVANHQLNWFAELITDLRQREAALFQERFGVTMPSPTVEVTAPTPADTGATSVPAQVSVRDVMGRARDMLDSAAKRAGKESDDPFVEDASAIFEDVGDARAARLGLVHDDEGVVASRPVPPPAN